MLKVELVYYQDDKRTPKFTFDEDKIIELWTNDMNKLFKAAGKKTFTTAEINDAANIAYKNFIQKIKEYSLRV